VTGERSSAGPGAGLDLVESPVRAGGRELPLLVPRSSEALLDERAFAERDEYLPYWAELWPSALALAEVVAAARPAGRVLELGCGLAVPSLVAALSGAEVLATDWSADAVEVLRTNARRCGARLEARLWDWSREASGIGAPFDLVLAADVLYERRNGPQLLAALPRLVAPGGEAWIADPGRATAEPFLAAAAGGWLVDRLAHPRPGSVTVHRLRRRGESAP
jgi:predicted nicotinamide N-methyase